MTADICCHKTVIRRLTSYNCYQTSDVRYPFLLNYITPQLYNCYQLYNSYITVIYNSYITVIYICYIAVT